MTIHTFFQYISRGDLSSRVFFLHTKERPVLLGALIQQFVANVRNMSTIVLDSDCDNYDEIIHVLGQATLFDSHKLCVIYVADYSVVIKKKILSFLQNYTGPHGILCIRDIQEDQLKCEEDVQAGRIYCSSETVPQYAEYADIIGFLTKKVELDERLQRQSRLFFDTYMQNKYALTLERMCVAAMYQQVVGRSADEFFAQWSRRVFAGKQTLFSLSSAFFARDAYMLEQWHEMRAQYGIEFWTVFFLSQLWQAYVFVAKRKLGQNPPSSRLPFSFIKKDWQQYSPAQLRIAYQRMYDIDCLFKQGLCSEIQIDAFIIWWLRYNT